MNEIFFLGTSNRNRTTSWHISGGMSCHMSKDEQRSRLNFHSAAGGVILKITYGWTVVDNDDYFVPLKEQPFVMSAEIMKPGR
jgi:hypothetical protein